MGVATANSLELTPMSRPNYEIAADLGDAIRNASYMNNNYLNFGDLKIRLNNYSLCFLCFNYSKNLNFSKTILYN